MGWNNRVWLQGNIAHYIRVQRYRDRARRHRHYASATLCHQPVSSSEHDLLGVPISACPVGAATCFLCVLQRAGRSPWSPRW